MNTERELKEFFKIFFAAHHFVYISKDLDEIAKVVRVKRSTLENWLNTPLWHEALMLWGYSPDIGDLRVAERVWKLMIEYGHDLMSIDFPDDLGQYIAEHEKGRD